MNFKLSSEQQLLQQSARRFIEKAYGFERRTVLVEAGPAGTDEHWRGFADMGWLAAALPECHGGLGGSVVDTALIAHELGRGLVIEPYLGCAVLAAQVLVAAGDTAHAQRLLPCIADGSRRVAMAWSEASSRGNPAVLATTATPCAGGVVLQGRKTLVLGACGADEFIVSAKLTGAGGDAPGVALFVVDATSPGVTRHSFPLHDGSHAAELHFDQVRLDQNSMLAAPDKGLPLLQQGVSHAVTALCSELVGGMEKAIELTADYLKVRQQFGVPIGSFQALQHRMADMAADLEIARSMLYALLATMENGDGSARWLAMSQAKTLIGRAAKRVCGQAIQLHGAIGVTEECAVGHYFKRAVVADLLFGHADWHEANCAAALQQSLRSGADEAPTLQQGAIHA